jgi:hypothetical protein
MYVLSKVYRQFFGLTPLYVSQSIDTVYNTAYLAVCTPTHSRRYAKREIAKGGPSFSPYFPLNRSGVVAMQKGYWNINFPALLHGYLIR